MRAPCTGWQLGGAIATVVAWSGAVACSSPKPEVAWAVTGDRAAFPSPLTVDKATAIAIDATYIYWITTGAWLYRAPRSLGEIARTSLPAPATLLGVHNNVYVGWTNNDGNAVVADIDPEMGTVTAVNYQAGALRALVAGQRGYSFAVTAPDGTVVQTCRDEVCTLPSHIQSDFKSLALDLPTSTFYVLTADGLRTCTLRDGCPVDAATTPAATTLIAALPGMYFLLDSNGQPSAQGGARNLASAAVVTPIKFVVVDGNGQTTSPVGTWSNGSHLAKALLAPSTTTTELPVACVDFDVDATGTPIYCLVGSSSIQVVP